MSDTWTIDLEMMIRREDELAACEFFVSEMMPKREYPKVRCNRLESMLGSHDELYRSMYRLIGNLLHLTRE
jgi:hypothetical protein